MREFFGQIIALFILFVIFAPLERIFALHKEQKIFRKGFRTDVLHFLFNRFLIDVGSFIVFVILAILLRPLINADFQNSVVAQPFLLQFVEAFLIANICGYFAHRLSHTIPFLWKFHKIHHSSENLDWLASARVHPFDQIFSRIVMFLPLYFLGFTKETFGAYIFFAIIHGIFIHSNVRFQLNFLRNIITTPVYHRWHHSNHIEAQNKNFAGELPILDRIFGTFYLPKEKVPEIYGISEPIPQSYPAQLKFPFKKSLN